MIKLKESEKSAILGLTLTLATCPRNKKFTFKRKFLDKIVKEFIHEVEKKNKKTLTKKEIETYLSEYGCIGYKSNRSQWYNWKILIKAIYKLYKRR